VLARSLENDSTAVTFVSFACSGAGIEHLVDKGYPGFGLPENSPRLRPQLVELGALIGDPGSPSTRTVDLLLGAIGINALNVGPTLKDCALDHFRGSPLMWLGVFLDDCERDFSPAFGRLPGLYDQLELAVSSNLRVAQFQLLGYPARLLTDDRDNYPAKLLGYGHYCGTWCKLRAAACFPFDNTRVDTKQFITRTVLRLNDLLNEAARRSEWWTTTQTTDLFRRHGYCALFGASWFRGLITSKGQQYDTGGTAHPNHKGHLAAAREVKKDIRLDAKPPAPDTFIVSILKLRLTVNDDSHRPAMERWRHGLVRATVPGATKLECRSADPSPALPAGQCRVFVATTSARTIAVSAHVPVTRLVPVKVAGEPGAVRSVVSDLLAQHIHRRGSNWNAGQRQHILEKGSAGTLELEYTLTKEPQGPSRGD